jgi:dihydroxyacid dehydratase/phosphogluconate dehydratase
MYQHTTLTLKEAREHISKERAEEIRKEIWASHGWNSKSMTKEEEQIIKSYWNSLPGETTFYDAVRDLATLD